MFTIINKIITSDSAKCLGYYVKNLDNGVEGAVSRDMVVALVTCSLIENITLDVTGRLTGINGFKVSSIKSRVMYADEAKNFKDMEYFSWTGVEHVKTAEDYEKELEKRKNNQNVDSAVIEEVNAVVSKAIAEITSENKSKVKNITNIPKKAHCISKRGRFTESENPKNIEKGKQKGFQNVEIRSVSYDEKTGHCYVIVRASTILFNKDFKNITTKSKREQGGVTFSAHLKNFMYKLEDMNLEKHQLIATKRTLVFIKRCMVSAKERKVTGVDMFNLVIPRTYNDLLDFYSYLCKNAIYIEDEEVKWLHDSQNIDK